VGTEPPAPLEIGDRGRSIDLRLAPGHDRHGPSPDTQGSGRTLLDFLLQQKGAEVALLLPLQGVFLQVESPGTGEHRTRGAGEQAFEGLLETWKLADHGGARTFSQHACRRWIWVPPAKDDNPDDAS